MKSIIAIVTLGAFFQLASAQGGSGQPSDVAQSTTPQAASSADRAVQARRDKVVARSNARAAKKAAKAASAPSE